MRPCYADYCKHAMRFYARFVAKNGEDAIPRFKTDADCLNWQACCAAMRYFTKEQQHMLIELYSKTDNMPDAIVQIAKAKSLSANNVWNIVNDLERKIATKRGLI